MKLINVTINKKLDKSSIDPIAKICAYQIA